MLYHIKNLLNMNVPAIGNDLERYIPTRYIFALLGSAAIGIVNALMVNLPMTMLGMMNFRLLAVLNSGVGVYENLVQTNSVSSYNSNIAIIMTTVLGSSKDKSCLTVDRSYKKELLGPFLWSPEQQGIILSSYFWGYFLSQLVGLTHIVEFSPKWMMLIGVMINILCTLLTPVLVKIHYFNLVLLRIIQGVGAGVTIPVLYRMLSKWTLPADRGRVKALIQTSSLIGIILSTFFSGMLTAQFGCPSVFYVLGGLSLFWCCLWIVWVQDSPQQQPFISVEERNMIVSSQKKAEYEAYDNLPVPWHTVLISKPFLAILIAHVCCNWGWYILLLELPFYLKLVLKLTTIEVTLTASLSYMSTLIFSIALGRMLEWLQTKNVIDCSEDCNCFWPTIRQLSVLCCLNPSGNQIQDPTGITRLRTSTLSLMPKTTIVPAVSLLLLCFVECNRIISIALIVFGVMSTGGTFYGFHSNYDDIAPNFADKLVMFTETIVTLPRIMVPIFVGAMTHGNNIYGIKTIFSVTIASYVIAFITYCLFAAIKEQPWNRETAKSNMII